MLKTANFDGKKITIKTLSKKDLKNSKKFQDFLNSLIKENAKISRNKPISLKQEKVWLKEEIKATKAHQKIFLIAEAEGKIVGTVEIGLEKGRQSHIGGLGISIRNGYRGIGLGKYLMKEIIKLAKKKLKSKPKIIRLSVLPNNKPAIDLYKKCGFKKVAAIPKQMQYKGKLLDEIVMLLD